MNGISKEWEALDLNSAALGFDFSNFLWRAELSREQRDKIDTRSMEEWVFLVTTPGNC